MIKKLHEKILGQTLDKRFTDITLYAATFKSEICDSK